MDDLHGEPVQPVPAAVPPTEETPASILPGSPRVASLDALLREVDGLRIALESDLSLAASAVENGAPGIAVGIIDSDRAGLHAFEDRALSHLSRLAVEGAAGFQTPRRRRRLRVSAVPFAAAAAVVGFLVAVLPETAPADDVVTSTVAASSSLEQLQDYAQHGNTSQIRAAATALHLQLLGVVAQAATNPAAAREALLLLSYERDAIVQSGDSEALADVLLQSTALANRIRNAMPEKVRVTVPRVTLVTPTATPSSSPTPRPKASPTTAPQPKPTASPTPSSDRPDDDEFLPTGNLTGG